MFSDFELRRIYKIAREYISEFDLNLKDLTVFTEAASGYYLFTSIICSMANAKMVYAITKDSVWGKAEDIKSQTRRLAYQWGCEDNIKVVEEKSAEIISMCDIITNTGFVRPIDDQIISWMKATAVVPLMWETWEYRPGEIDLDSCREKGILVMGTDEENRLARFQFSGYLAWHLLFKSKIEVFKNRIFIFGSGPIGKAVNEVFYNNKIEYRWSSFDPSPPGKFKEFYIPSNDKAAILAFISSADAIICVEHFYNKPVIAENGVVTPEEILQANDTALLLYLCGSIDYEKIKALGITIYPDRKVPFGYYTTSSYELGPRAVLQLSVAGLKVGEAMARARLKGMNIDKAEQYALLNSPAMKFNRH